MKYKKFDILKKAKYSIIPNNRELYIVYVECDGDYMRDTIEFDKSSFEEDELLLLVLSYVSKYSGKFSEGKSWNCGYYGHHVDDNKDFPRLSNYLSENDNLIFAGMCHSVSGIDIVHYDGIANKVKLPDKFKVANQEITVVMEDSLPNNSYGYFCDATNTIKLARTVNSEHDGTVSLSDEQIRNTFYHELFHVFQFYSNNEFNETQAQVYANFMCEFIETTEEPF